MSRKSTYVPGQKKIYSTYREELFYENFRTEYVSLGKQAFYYEGNGKVHITQNGDDRVEKIQLKESKKHEEWKRYV